MELHIGNDRDGVIEEIASMINNLAHTCVEERNRFTWALSGGSSPKDLFQLLANEYKDQFPWEKTWFYFGDERYVPQDHPDSNYLMARKAMLDAMKVNPDHIFPVNTSLSPKDAALEYQAEILTSFGTPFPRFDLVLLGLGDDAHTASLFPGTTVLDNSTDLVSEVFLPEKEVYRITFTKKLINNAGTVAFLTFGRNKSQAVRQVIRKEGNSTMYPAQLIDPESGDLRWYIDEAAASEIR